MAMAIAATLVVAGAPPFDGYPFPVAMATVMSATVVADAYVGIDMVVRDDCSDDDSTDEATDDGFFFVAGASGVGGDECCGYGE